MKRLGIKRILQLLFLVITLVLIAMTITAQALINHFEGSSQNLYQKYSHPLQSINHYKGDASEIRFLLTSFSADIIPGPGVIKSIKEVIPKLNKYISYFKEIEVPKDVKAKKSILKLINGHKNFIKVLNKSILKINNNDKEAVQEVLEDDWVDILINVYRPLKSLQKEYNKSFTNKVTLNKIKSEEIRMISIIFAVVTIFIIAVIMLSSISYLSTNITTVNESLNEVSDQISEISTSIDTGTRSLIDNIQKQVINANQTASAAEEVGQLIRKNSNFSEESLVDSRKCLDLVKEGRFEMTSMSDAFITFKEDFDNAINLLQKDFYEFSKISDMINEISTKTGLINNIVFQTKLLSFNASVEAARAGEHGKGFAVVAEEVGNLADMSGKAAEEISEILNKSIGNIDVLLTHSKSSLNNFSDSMGKDIGTTSHKINQCTDIFNSIENSVTEINSKVDSISNSANEQTTGTDEIVDSINYLNQSISEIERIATSYKKLTTSLTYTSIKLVNVSSDTKVLVSGSKAAHQRNDKTVQAPMVSTESSGKYNSVEPKESA